MTSHVTKRVREMSFVSEPEKTDGIANPIENEISTVAYKLWIDGGCLIGSDQQHWFQAEAILRNALVAECEDLSIRPSIPRYTLTESEMVAHFTSDRWEGHWEVWEREWADARWVWDVRDSGARVSDRAG
jgi:hypothetical protein